MLDGPHDGLVAHAGTVAVWRGGSDRLRWLPEGAAAAQDLPHDEIALATFTTDGSLLTVSRSELKRWRDGRLQGGLRLDEPLSPLALSDDAALLLAVSYETRVQVRDVRPNGNGRLIATLAHQERVVAACACGGQLVTGDLDGVLRVWRASDGSLVRQWAAYAGPVSLLRCRGERLLSAGRSGLAEQHALLWDLAGRAPAIEVETAGSGVAGRDGGTPGTARRACRSGRAGACQRKCWPWA